MTIKKSNIKIAIVASKFNSSIVDRLYNGAIATFKENGITENEIKLISVPGAFEIPVAVKTLLNKKIYDVITIGILFDFGCGNPFS